MDTPLSTIAVVGLGTMGTGIAFAQSASNPSSSNQQNQSTDSGKPDPGPMHPPQADIDLGRHSIGAPGAQAGDTSTANGVVTGSNPVEDSGPRSSVARAPCLLSRP
jgi:hypothetical protein